MSFSGTGLVIGHRGAAGLCAENTLPSFRRAWECGVDAVELDVHIVQGELVVIHDDTLERTTSGTGRVAQHTLASLRALDAGGSAQIPLLREVVAELPDDVGLNIELKGPATAVPVAEFLTRHPHVDALVSSFDHGLLRQFRQHDPRTRVAPLYSRWRRNVWETAEALNAWSINLSRRAATSGRLQEAARRGTKTLIYTVNDVDDARLLVSQGATGVFTDYPDRVSRRSISR